MKINFWAKKCIGQSLYGCYCSYVQHKPSVSYYFTNLVIQVLQVVGLYLIGYVSSLNKPISCCTWTVVFKEVVATKIQLVLAPFGKHWVDTLLLTV